ncbi:hypothetical protein J132_10203 [Termitomyces sp. J132]|nr:hypothetical protein J132_10203 [Termitomyces sp. J132]
MEVAQSRAGGASAGWAEGGSILGGRPWEVESFPAIRGGAQQEAAGVRADGRFSGVSRSLSYPGRSLEMSIKFSRAPAFNHGGLPLQAGGGANGGTDSMGGGASMGKGGLSMAQAEKEALERAWNTSVQVAPERVLEVRGLWERPMQWGVWSTEEAEEWGMALEGGPLQAELEVARQREDWLANEAASGCMGILCWVREHQVLLDGASMVFASIQDGLAQMPMG